MIAFTFEKLKIYYSCDPITTIIPKTSKTSPVSLAFFHSLTFYKLYSLIFIFSTLCVVHDQIFQWKLSRRRLPITFVYFVSHASAQALRPITFTQRFRTTRHLFSIQLLWKPEILNVEDKQTKFERSKGSSFRIMQMLIDTSAIEQTHGFALFLRCWWMKATDIPVGLRQSMTSLVYKLHTDMLF